MAIPKAGGGRDLRLAPHKAPVRKMRQKPDRAKKTFVTTCSRMNVTGHRAPPTAGTTLMAETPAATALVSAVTR